MGVTRRGFLRRAGAAGAGAAALGLDALPAAAASTAVPFEGVHQAGITTPPQAHLLFAAFDVTATGRAELRALLAAWTDAARALTAGRPAGDPAGPPAQPPADTGEALGLGACRLTLTLGFGPSLFDARFGLAGRRPPALADLPAFPADRLDPAACGGDLAVQACADDPQACFHAVRTLARIGRDSGAARPRYTQAGFLGQGAGTGRNLLGFKDGSNNLPAADGAAMRRNVWVQPGDGPGWMRDGTYLVVRRVRTRIERWDASALSEQEADIGRRKVSGAGFGLRRERDPLVPGWEPDPCHVMLANPRTAGSEAERILRRGYNFDDGLLADGTLDAGLFFAAYQRDPRRQFVPIQRRLAAADPLNEYLVHTGSGVFAVPPGVRPGGRLGETLI